jgi:hypothetical protein
MSVKRRNTRQEKERADTRRRAVAMLDRLDGAMMAQPSMSNAPHELEVEAANESEGSDLSGFPCPVLTCGGKLAQDAKEGFVCDRCGHSVASVRNWASSMSSLSGTIGFFRSIERDLGIE